MRDRFDYGLNPKKCSVVSSYLCDPATADAEFMLCKQQYEAKTGRDAEGGHLFIQLRQAFPAGEVTPEQANQLGYETAMRWTKGKYQFFVCTHTDRGHIHNHIYYNTTAYDCSRKFHNFWGSTFAFRRLSDRVCIEHGLSVIEKPKQHSHSRFRHYGQWATSKGYSLSHKDKLREDIDAVLAEHPADFDTFLSCMETAGYEIKHGRGGSISFLAPGWKQPTRLRASKLGEGYDPEDIRAIITGFGSSAETPARRVNLIVDIQKRLREGKGPGYERWARVFNLKQMAAALVYLQENGLLEYDRLVEKAEETAKQFHALAGQIKDIEAELAVNRELKAAIVKYAQTRPVFEEYKAAGYSRTFLAEHEAELSVYRTARSDFQRLLNGAKLPKMGKLKEEGQELIARKKEMYASYQKARRDMQEALAAKANIDYLLGCDRQSKNKEQER